MLRKWIENIIKQLFPQLIQQVFVLRPENQYIIIVKSDQVAQDIHEACTKYLDVEKGPRLAIVVASDVSMVELQAKK